MMSKCNLVYKDDVIDAIKKNMPYALFDDCGHYTMRGMRLLDVISAVPSVQVERKKGKWIDTGSGQECDQCHEIQYGYDNYRYFCPNCGADMKGENR